MKRRNRAGRRWFGRDARANMHILEVMVVGLLIGGAIVAITTLQPPERDVTSVREGQRAADDFLGLYMALPPQATSIHFTSRLEELVLMQLACETPGGPVPCDRTLTSLLGAHGIDEPRLFLESGGTTRHVAGKSGPAQTGTTHGGTAFWHSAMGTTILVPTMNIHGLSMPVYVEAIPIANHRAPMPPGIPYTVAAEFTRSGDDAELRQQATFQVRAPMADQAAPIRIEPMLGGVVRYEYTDAEVKVDGDYVWKLFLRITPEPPEERTWLGASTLIAFEPPPGWEVEVESPENWTRISSADAPFLDLQYAGRPHRGAGEGWLNLTLTRSGADPIVQHEHLSVRQLAPGWTETRAVISPTDTPASARQNAPITIFHSQPGPLPVENASAMHFTVTNPYGAALSLTSLTVKFPLPDEFRHDPAGWQRSPAAVYSYTGPAVTIPAYRAHTFALEMKVENRTGENLPAGQRLVVEYLGAGDLDPPMRDGLLGGGAPGYIAHPHGANGVYLARVPGGTLTHGEHTLRVGGDSLFRFPPAQKVVAIGAGDSAQLEALQEARATMALTTDAVAISRSAGFDVNLDAGTLDAFLAANPAVKIGEVRVRSADLYAHLSGDAQHAATVTYGTGPIQIPPASDAFPGPVVVTVDVRLTGLDVGDVTLHFATYAFRTAQASPVNAAFVTLHLQSWAQGLS